MADDIQDIAAHYDEDPLAEAARLGLHQLERDLTWRILDRYLPASGPILDLGAAAGAYTLPLAKRGYAVTAIDLSKGLVELLRSRLQADGLDDQVTCLVADARDLSAVTRNDFRAALMMGPLYHLVHEADRRCALRQAFERLRPGGLIFSSCLSRFGVLSDLLRTSPEWIEEQSVVRALLEQGRRPEDAPRGGFRGYFATPSEIAPLHEAEGLGTVLLAGVEPAIGAHDEDYNRLDDPQRTLWLDVLEELSTIPSVVGASRHLLYVGRKPR